MIYSDWGFTGSPFQTTSLPPSDTGSRLLVGRRKELTSLKKRIEAAPKLATLEGLNGVGKTSLVNVAAYELYTESIKGGTLPLFIPCRKIFQLNPQQNLDAFVDGVLIEVAQTLIDERRSIQQFAPNLPTGAVDKWLNSPQLKSYSGGAWGVQAGFQSETNTSSGFERNGFRKLISGWLEELFPTSDSGGVVCTIDNLELLQSSEIAKAQLEQLRDTLLNLPGLRWVLCGALGIVYGVVASPRLEGYLHSPIEVSEISTDYAGTILKSRMIPTQ